MAREASACDARSPSSVKWKHFSAQERAIAIHIHDLEALPALSENIQPAIVVALHDFDNVRSASRPGQRILLRQNHTEELFRLQTFTDHFFIAGFKDMQRQKCFRKQDYLQRK